MVKACAHLLGCFVRVTVAVKKHHDTSNLWRQGFIWLTYPASRPLKGAKERIWKQELLQRPWRLAARSPAQGSKIGLRPG